MLSNFSTTFVVIFFLLLPFGSSFGNNNLTAQDELCQFFIKQCPYLRSYRTPPQPYKPYSSTTYIFAVVTLVSLIDIDAYNQLMTIAARIELGWLMETCIDFGSPDLSPEAQALSVCQIPKKDIWTPSLVIANNIGDSNPMKDFSNDYVYIKRYEAGDIPRYTAFSSFQFKITTSCHIDPQKFPFNSASCKWDMIAQDDNKDIELNWMELIVQRIDNMAATMAVKDATFVPASCMWELTEIFVENGTMLGVETELNTNFRVVLNFNRKIQYYVAAIFVPLVLMIITQFAVFIMPPNSDRITFSVTVLLAVSVLQPVFTNDIPRTANPVYLFYYLQSHTAVNSLITIYMILAGSYVSYRPHHVGIVRLIDLFVFLACLFAIIVFNAIFFDYLAKD